MSSWNDVLAAVAGLGLDDGGGVPWFPTRIARSLTVAEQAPATVEALVAASDVVVQGRVVSVGPGPVRTGDDGTRIFLREVTLAPIEVLKGRVRGALLLFDEPGYTADGAGFEVNGQGWSDADDEGWFFLERTVGERMRLASSYGRYLTWGSLLGPSGVRRGAGDPWPVRMPGDDAEAVEAIHHAVTSTGKKKGTTR